MVKVAVLCEMYFIGGAERICVHIVAMIFNFRRIYTYA